jgi:hypothetical protein
MCRAAQPQMARHKRRGPSEIHDLKCYTRPSASYHTMPDPLRSDGPRALDAAPDASRDAKIEQLLLAGLDHYFAEQYEQAVNVWTRVLFLDRSHPKARAYIERGRSALAERQRRSEELVHTGVAALHRGDGDEARRLIQAAIDGGGSDEAFDALDRLERLQAASVAPPVDPVTSERQRIRPARAVVAPPRAMWSWLVVSIVLVVFAAGAVAASTWNRSAWINGSVALPTGRPEAASAPAVTAPVSDALTPAPRRGEMALGRARALAAGGHLHDAVAALDEVRPTDPQRADADRLRADIQHQLLGLPIGSAGKGDGPLP